MTTVNLNAAYFPAVEFVSALATVGDPARRRAPGDRRRHRDRRARRLHRRAQRLLRPDRPALAGLHDLPVRHGGARQDLRAARRASPTSSTRRTRSSCRRIRGEIRFDDVSFALPHRGRSTKLALDRRRPRRPARADGRARRRHRRRQVDVRQARRALLRPDRRARARRRPRPARRHARSRCARRWGSCRRRRSCSAARSPTTSPSGAPDATREELEAAARAVGAVGLHRARSPTGYDTEVGERGVQLSAGQRQLVAFARALVADPRILVLDEATSNVDLHTEGTIEAGLRRLLAGPHRDRHRPPPVDDPPGRAASSCSSTAGSSSRARTTSCIEAAAARYWRLYRDWAEQAAA